MMTGAALGAILLVVLHLGFTHIQRWMKRRIAVTPKPNRRKPRK
jgi:ABC-type Fe3+ transport system permease subunit